LVGEAESEAKVPFSLPDEPPAVISPMLDREQLRSLRVIVTDGLAELDLLYEQD
jgi:hypothetical protein